jgi:hypothetical protein
MVDAEGMTREAKPDRRTVVPVKALEPMRRTVKYMR